jgi:hypothetical protein
MKYAANSSKKDVTEIIGSGNVNMGFKAMIHTLAVRLFVDIVSGWLTDAPIG